MNGVQIEECNEGKGTQNEEEQLRGQFLLFLNEDMDKLKEIAYS